MYSEFCIQNIIVVTMKNIGQAKISLLCNDAIKFAKATSLREEGIPCKDP